MKTLLVEGIHPGARERLEMAGFDVTLEKGALSEVDALKRLQSYRALGIRSKTQLTEQVIEAAEGLDVIGAFCIGTNQIDLNAANRKGIPVFNAPYSNTRSVAELIIAEIVALSRRLCEVSRGAHGGGWLKSATGAREVRGKTLGIIGYGHIGSQVSVLAESMGLKVIYHDIIKKLPLGNARSVETLDELLGKADFVTLHVPETPQTKDMIRARELSLMKKGSFLLNASRGTVVDISALAQSLKNKHLAGAAIDVFPVEPKNNDERFSSELQELSNVILTPHIGGSTEEAQEAIGLEVAESLARYLTQGSSLGAVNFPQIDCPPLRQGVRLANVHRNVPGVLSKVNSIVSKYNANIEAQYLSTDSHIGYLVMDLSAASSTQIHQEISQLSESLRTRILEVPRVND